MKKKFIIIMAVIVLSVLCVSSVMAADTLPKPDGINSKGRIVFDNGTSDTTDDVVFDSNDIYYLDSICK